MKIIWIQRYPSDKPKPIALSDADAHKYLRQKQEDYRYTTGKVWLEYVEQIRERQR